MLRELFDEIPADFNAYLDQIADGSYFGHDEFELNLLPIEEVVRWTQDFRSFHPVISALRGVILDDPNTSDHHVYLSSPPCAGSILFLNHDGDSHIVFEQLTDFLIAARTAKKTGMPLRTLHPYAVVLPNQRDLSRLIVELYEGRHGRHGNTVVVSLIPSMDMADTPLLRTLAVDDDFYVAEAIGNTIMHRPRLDLEPIARICADHAHCQAAAAGHRAVEAIAALR